MTNILLLFGGESSEHDVSVASAVNVDRAIDRDTYNIDYGYIDRDGKWWLVQEPIDSVSGDAKQLLPQLGKKSFMVEGTDVVLCPDVILPILHGRNGEDGSVQALAQLLHIPIVGCDMTSSAAAMNKYITKQLASAHDIKTVPFEVHYQADSLPNYVGLANRLGDTLFIKPANAGSSVGVHKATSQDELDSALRDAHCYDEIVLIESAINARELEVAVLGYYPNIDVSAVTEIKPDGEFYSFDSKYDQSSQSEVVIPADISLDLSEGLRSDAAKLFRILGCSGMARVDFFLDRKSGIVYLNEINTIPGFTDISVYPKAWEYAGIGYAELIDRLIQQAIESHKTRS